MDTDVKTPDGICDAVFIHPARGSHPGVLLWHDSPGLRPVIRDLGKRIAAEGYSVLVPNLFYRAHRDRKSTRLNSSHGYISYAVFCLKKKNHLRKHCLREQQSAGMVPCGDQVRGGANCHEVILPKARGIDLHPGVGDLVSVVRSAGHT